jgi:hypothetical protein
VQQTATIRRIKPGICCQPLAVQPVGHDAGEGPQEDISEPFYPVASVWAAVVCAALLALIVTMTVSAQRPQQAVAARNGIISGTVQGERGLKQASGSLPKPRTCRPTSSRLS